MRRFMSFLAGTVVGAFVGAAVALLLTPASGNELRSRAQERFSALRDEVREAYAARKAQLESELEALRGERGE
jgi:gas vesicle protein